MSEAARYRLVRPRRAPAVAPCLDAAQQAVVDHPGGPLLVLAGPGTGKTATLVEAVVDRIANRGADPESVLMLTFSRRAAIELRTRVTARLGRTTREPLARTFHSYAFGLLRAQAARDNEPLPRLLSGPEQDLVVRELLLGDLQDGEEALRAWPAGLRPALSTRGFAEEMRDLLLRAVERGVDPRGLARLARRYDRPDWRAAALFYQQYLDVTALSGSSAYDPAELIRAALDALRADPDLLARERAQHRHMFVDEYQDTDPAQEELLQVVGAGADELVVVGDPDQSIYAFRGADSQAIRQFPDRFGGPTLALNVSRRGGAVLLAASRRIAERLSGPAGHRRLVPAEGTPAGRPEVHLLTTPSEEAAYVAARLRAAHLRDGVPWSQMAVLVRSTRRSLPQLRRALLGAGVPVAVGGDELPLVDQPAVSAFLMLLQVALGRAPLDETMAIELLSSPFGGADALDLRRLRRALRQEEIEAGGRRGSGALLVAAIDAGTDRPEPPYRPIRRLVQLMQAARTAAAAPNATAEDVLWAVWSTSGLASLWERASQNGGPAGTAADRDLDAIVALFSAAARYVDRLPAAGPAGFVDYLVGQQIPGDTLAPQAPAGEAVRLLTAHASKGLQWDLVVVAGVQEGVWPDLRRRGSLLGSELLIDVVAGRDSSASLAPLLDEERRLFYVAATRARRSLIVTAVRGDEEQPSRFLDELDPLPARTERPITPVPRTLSLPGVVAELRAVVCDTAARSSRREAAARQLARLAAAGVRSADPKHWWGLPGLSDQSPLRAPEEPVQVSPSSVEKYHTCELRWLLETVGGTTGTGLAQTMGNLIHDLAAWSAGPQQPDPGTLVKQLDTALDTIELGGPWMARKERQRAHTMLGKFLHWLAGREGRMELVGAELDFEAAVGDRAVIRGRVDRLERDPRGRLVVVDLKTGRSAPTKDDVARNAQLGVYQLAVAQGAFEAGSEPGGAALVQLGTTAANTKVQLQEPLDSDQDLQWARDLVSAVADGMGGSAFLAKPNSRCRTCPARYSCPALDEGRQVP